MTKEYPSVLALGTFDGVHKGHRALIEQTIAIAQANGCKSVVHTFSNHPRSIFSRQPDMLQTAEERRETLESLGIDIVYMETFDTEYAALSQEEFIHRLLAHFNVKAVVIGFDYTFGHHGSGNIQNMQTLGERFGFSVTIVQPVLFRGKQVSSTWIRECIEAGNLKDATAMLEGPYMFTGVVVKNKRIGTSIGFPTANILPAKYKVLPKYGVYASIVVVDGDIFPAITNVGNNPTVYGEGVSIESHLIDYNGDLYNKLIRVYFYEFIRSERRFKDKTALSEQIAKDVRTARNFFLHGTSLKQKTPYIIKISDHASENRLHSNLGMID